MNRLARPSLLGNRRRAGLAGNHPPDPRPRLTHVSFVGNRFIASYLQDVVSQVKVFAIDGRFLRRRCPAGHWRRGRLRRQAGRQRNLLWLFEHRHPAEHLSLRHRHRRKPFVAPGRNEVQSRRLRSQAGLLPQQGRHANPDVHRRQEGHQTRRLEPRRCSRATAASTSRVPPIFSVSRVVWMEMGGVYAQPTLRGGGEYGEAWHQAGTKLKKQNVFDDFIAAAEWLVRRKVHPPRQTGHPGRQQRRPAGRRGNDPAARPVRRLPAQRRRDGHAPLPEVHRGPYLGRRLRLLRRPRTVQGPPGLFPLSQHQAGHLLSGHARHHGRHRRPRHSRPQLQVRRRAATCPGVRQAPVLIRISTRSGHGGGKPIAKRIEEIADDWAFLVKNLRFTAQGATAGLSSSAETTVGQPARGTPQPLPTDGDKAIVEKLAPICAKYNVPAIGAAIVTSRGLEAVGVVGVRKAGTNVPATINDQWHLASDTKAMTGTLAGKLVEQGKLRWDITVAEAFPDLAPAFDPEARNITLTQLLTHRSGLVGNLDWEHWSVPGTIRQQRLALVKQALSAKPTPGHKWLYSNVGYTIAGAIIEKVTGTSWEEAIRKELFVPLGMTSAGFGGTGTPGIIDQPWPHTGDGKPTPANGPEVDNPAVISPAGRVHCSLGDWAKFVADHIRGDQGKPALLKPATYKALHTPLKGESYGKGWGVSRTRRHRQQGAQPGPESSRRQRHERLAGQNLARPGLRHPRLRQRGQRPRGKAIDEAVKALAALHKAQHPAKLATP